MLPVVVCKINKAGSPTLPPGSISLAGWKGLLKEHFTVRRLLAAEQGIHSSKPVTSVGPLQFTDRGRSNLLEKWLGTLSTGWKYPVMLYGIICKTNAHTVLACYWQRSGPLSSLRLLEKCVPPCRDNWRLVRKGNKNEFSVGHSCRFLCCNKATTHSKYFSCYSIYMKRE